MKNKKIDLSIIFGLLFAITLLVLIIYIITTNKNDVSNINDTTINTTNLETITIEEETSNFNYYEETQEEIPTITSTSQSQMTTPQDTQSVNDNNINNNNNNNYTENINNPQYNIVVDGSQVEFTTSKDDNGNDVYNIEIN